MCKARKKNRKQRTTTTNISMPESLRKRVEARIQREGFGNVSEYFRHLVREDERRHEYERRRMGELIEEGERSGTPIVADDKFWTERHDGLRRRLSAGRRKAS